MSRAPKIERPRGTHDVIPSEQPLWRRVTSEIERLCELYGYRPITTPVFEDTALFERTSGAGSDVVQKEMYTFSDRSDRSLTLRPEATAPICRAYLEHGLHREPQPQKLYTIASIYRYAAPQKGRFREHFQFSCEAIGSDDPAIDAELIQLYDTLLRTLGVTKYRLELNSIGDRACRPAYLELLRAYLIEHDSDLDAATRDQALRNPLRALDNIRSRPPATQSVLRGAPTIGNSLCDACAEHFAAVRSYLDAYGIVYELVPTLVRGLDYYTRTTFEFIGPESGAQSTICGGGRYDQLVEEIGGPPTPGVGFGAGIERLRIAMEGEGVAGAEPPKVDVFFLTGPDVAPDRRRWVLNQMRALRGEGYACDTDYIGRSRKGQATQAGRLGARLVVEVESQRIFIRGQQVVPEETLAELVRRALPL